MSYMIIWILAALVINSLLGFIGVLTFWIKESLLNKMLIYFVAFSAGALLGGFFSSRLKTIRLQKNAKTGGNKNENKNIRKRMPKMQTA